MNNRFNSSWGIQPPRVAVASPCIKICEMDKATDQCRGCYRTIDEIAHWMTMSPAARERVMAQIQIRKSKNLP